MSEESSVPFVERLKATDPTFTPSKSAPSLYRINGIGTTLLGSRPFSGDHGVYVKTRFFSVVFIPLFALDAHVVADAPEGRGWYFLGKVPLSTTCKRFNHAMLSLIAIAAIWGGLDSHFNSPEYLANKRLEAAEAKAAAGEIKPACDEFKTLARENVPAAAKAREDLRKLIGDRILNPDPELTAEGFVLFVSLPESLRSGHPSARYLDAGYAVLANPAKDATVFALLGALRRHAPADPRLSPALDTTLARLVKSDPESAPYAIELALLRESQGKAGEALALLSPHATKLGDGDGARILGSAYVAQGDFDKAFPLLKAYVTPRLAGLKKADAAISALYDRLQNEELSRLQNNRGPAAFYTAYEAAPTKEEKQTLVSEHLASVINKSPEFEAGMARLREANAIVPVAMEFGLTRLRRAESMEAGPARGEELKEAEKTFLSLREAAGETSAYKLFLGEVYFWMGRQTEGRKLFDELLAQEKRTPSALLTIANTVRELGDVELARTYAEEAFAAPGSDEKLRFAAAEIRAVIAKDPDDEILWKKRSDLSQPATLGSYESALANKASFEGDDTGVATHSRLALEAYSKCPENATVINNRALVLNLLYQNTGSVSDYERSVADLEKSHSLQEQNTTSTYNLAYALQVLAGLRTFSDRMTDTQRRFGGGSISWYERDYGDHVAAVELLKKRPEHARARRLFEGLLVTSPLNRPNYAALANIYQLDRDAPALRRLSEKARRSALQPEPFDEPKPAPDSLRAALIGRQLAAVRDAPSRAALLTAAASIELGRWSKGEKADLARALSQAEEARGLLPCVMTASLARAVKATLVVEACRAGNPAFAKFSAAASQKVDTFDQLLLGCESGLVPADTPAVREWFESQLPEWERHPYPGLNEWFVRWHTRSPGLKAYEETLRKTDWPAANDEWDQILTPGHPDTMIRHYIFLKSTKGDAAAVEYWKTARATFAWLPEIAAPAKTAMN